MDRSANIDVTFVDIVVEVDLVVLGESVEPIKESTTAVNDLVGLVIPVEVVGGRSREKVEEPKTIGPTVSKYSGRDEVALGLGHLRSGESDHALREQSGEGLARQSRRPTEIVERLQVEARIEQVENRVLDAADVLIDRHPLCRCAGSKALPSVHGSA